MSAAERLRAPSAGNLRDPGGHYPPPQQQQQQLPPQHDRFNRRMDNRDMMDKSKSIPNLHMDHSFDGHNDRGMMRPAQSVSTLQQQRMPNSNNVDYYNQPHSLEESRNPDYENQPMDPRLRLQDPGRGYPGAGQSSPGGQFGKPHMQQQSQMPRSSQNFERPQSQYIDQQGRANFTQGRPRSEEITPEKLRNFQDMDRSQGSSHDQSFENRANYSNIRPQPNYANQGEIRKMDMGNQPRQPNFYENTMPRQQDPAPPFQQLRRPPNDTDKRPTVAAKPPVAAKPNQPLVQPAEIPRSEVDNRQTQPHFYNARPQDRYPGSSQMGYGNNMPNSQSHYQNTNFHDGRADLRTKQDTAKQFDMQQEVPPELPPPPSMEELQDEDLPPLPPPPVTDYRLEQKIKEDQNRMMQMDPSYSNLPPQNTRNQPITNGQRSQDRPGYPGNHSLPPHSAGFQPPQSAGYNPPISAGYQPPHSAGYQPQQPQSLPTHPAGYQPSHDYQNINYPNRGEPTPTAHQPQQNLYESYDPRKQPQGKNFRPQIHKQIKDQHEAIVSPWQREEREKQQKQQESDLNRLREMEIADLESRPQLSPQEQERLRRLKLDHEFQRRLQEVANKDDDEDSDSEDRFMAGRISIQSVQEDLVKSRMRMQELEQKRMYDDMEKEKERMQRGILKSRSSSTEVDNLKRHSSATKVEETPQLCVRRVSQGLERRMEMFEREREEQKQRNQRRKDKQQKEQDEYMRKQKEAREKQKREIEENLRMQKQEAEKLKQRKQAEEQKRKEMEAQRKREIQVQKDAEEAAAREEIRRQEEEYQRRQRMEEEQRRREADRDIRVAEERKRLEAMSNQQAQNAAYIQPYENLPAQGPSRIAPDMRYAPNQYGGPPTPERGSSFGNANRNMNSRVEDQSDRYNGGYRVNNPSSPFRSSQENIQKKSVSFNTQMNSPTSVEPEQHSPPASYQPFQRAYVSPEQNYNTQSGYPGSPSVSSANAVNNNNDVQYKTQDGTPTVIGSQEVYRDPRTRIEAKMANKGKQQADRLSFRDKMKFFAQEAGEGTPKEKPKASTTQRRIESQVLYNGQ